MPSRSKTKGSANERGVAKILSEWWGSKFTRTPNSGGLRWGGEVWEYGDLLPPSNCPCVFECKHERAVRFDTILKGTRNAHTILGWWDQVCADAKRCYEDTKVAAQPILIFKANHQPYRIAIESNLYVSLDGDARSMPAFWIHRCDCIPFVILDLLQFLDDISPEIFLKALGEGIPTALVESAA